MKVLGLIPARGGSKGLLGKNVKPLAGKSLIERAYETAVASLALDRIILSSDNDTIIAAAAKFGLEAPFMRPAALATDSSPMIDVAVHALDELGRKGYEPDALMLLQPTSPLRRPSHISCAIELLADNDAVCSVIQVPLDLSPHYVMKITDRGFLDYFLPEGRTYIRRQDVPRAYKRDGTIFLTRRSVILGQRSFYGQRCVPLHLAEAESLNIDTAEDWAEAERRLYSDH
jgi:CMP-N,N'-diacetyllegionaminic acid synthase